MRRVTTVSHSNEPITRTLRRLMRERGHSNRSLGEVTGLSAGAIGNIAAGRDRPGPDALERIAAGLGVDPEVFVEYRLARARALLDERAVGLRAAVATYDLVAEALRLAEPPGGDRAAAARQMRDQLRDARQRWLGEGPAEAAS